MKKLVFLLALLLCFPLVSGCGEQNSARSSNFFLMDTTVTVTLYGVNEERAGEVFADCRAFLSELDALWSRTDAESEISAFRVSKTGIENADPRTVALVAKALDVAEKTGGAFDPTVAPLVDLWQTCGEEDRLPSDAELKAAIAARGTADVTCDGNAIRKAREEIAIDLGGIGKGAAIGLLVAHLREENLPGGLISFGSNIAVFGSKPDGSAFRLGIRDPQGTSDVKRKFETDGGMILSVSGDYERYVTIGGERYHHLLNPETGYPVENGLSSVAVLCADGALADALSTALFVMGEERAMQFYQSGAYEFEAFFIRQDGSVAQTAGFPD